MLTQLTHSSRAIGLLLTLFIQCTLVVAGSIVQHDDFQEDLYLRPLADGKLFAHFQFKTAYRKDIKSLRWENKFELFPFAVADLVAKVELEELHFSLTKGNWDHKNWGHPARSSPPGAQIRAKFQQLDKSPGKSWQRMLELLSGMFCSSLATADNKLLVETQLSQLTSSNLSHGRTLYANLPDESVCTANLIPWKHLLPCPNSGLISLLNGLNLFKSSHSSLSIDLEPKKCLDKHGDVLVGCEQVQLIQSISVVFNPLIQFEGRQTWSLAKIFGGSIQGQCRQASHSLVHVDITDLADRGNLYPQNYQEYSLEYGHLVGKQQAAARRYATYNLQSIMNGTTKTFNLGMKQSQFFKRPPLSSRTIIPIQLETHIAGIGAFEGTIVATITNSNSEPVRISYMDVAPYYLIVYLHTLTIRTKSGQELKPDKFNLVPRPNDEVPTLIEFSLLLPANSETQISYDFKRAFLKWTEYKPDANRGVLLGSAMISVTVRHEDLKHLVMPACETHGQMRFLAKSPGDNSTMQTMQLVDYDERTLQIYARPIMLIQPTPDFSMPYNVLCLVCTVLIFAFGPIYNMTTQRPVVKLSSKRLL